MKKYLAAVTVLLLPLTTSAHEVYVLSAESIQKAMSGPQPNPFEAIIGNELQFLFWGFVSAIVLSTVLAATLFHAWESKLAPTLRKMKPFALPVARITVGATVIAFAYAGMIYGSELQLSALFGSATAIAQIVLALLGALLVVGLYTREVGALLIGLFLYSSSVFGVYVLTYTDFLGAFVLLAILGSGKYSLEGDGPSVLKKLTAFAQPIAFPFLRVCLGWGVLFASVYAKFLYAQLALEVVVQHDLTRFFPFEPLFVVLGALIIEFIIGLMLVFGIAIRWTLVFLAFWLTLSLIYFQEMIWPHGILFGLAITLFLHGYDAYSIERYAFRNRKQEPVL